MTLPTLVIAGVNKAGTTSLFRALAAHPDVAVSDVKETCHFLPLRYGEPQPGLDVYRRHFRHVGDEPVVVEATPGYFYGGDVIAPALREAVPDIKVVISLREPVDRFHSFFRAQKSALDLPADLSVGEYLDACAELDPGRLVRERALNPWFGLEGGCYARYLPAWTRTLPADALRLVFFDDLVQRPDETLASLTRWLGIARPGGERAGLARENRTVQPRSSGVHRMALRTHRRLERVLGRHRGAASRARDLYWRLNRGRQEPGLSPQDRARLEQFYAPHVADLADQIRGLGLTAPAWVP